MKAFKCDRCGELIDGDWKSDQVFEFPTGDWAQKLEKVRVSVRVSPVGHPTGYGSVELCAACFVVYLGKVGQP